MVVEPMERVYPSLPGVGTDEIQHFVESFHGRVLFPEDAGYDEARTVRNGMINRRPAIIAQCRGVADVVQAVNLARDHGLVLSVRGGAHNAAGNAVNDGGLVVDLSLMRSVHVDPLARSARVEGGATWSDLDRETQVYGLATPGGVVSSTGVGGLSLHGGYGHLRRKHGLSLDNIISAEVVTSSGQVKVASLTSEPELFWALRGAGSTVGVVTSFEFQLHPVGPEVFLCAPAYSLDDGLTVLRAWREFMSSATDEVNGLFLLWSVPMFGPFPDEVKGKPVVVLPTVYVGPVEEAMRVVQPLRELAPLVLDLSHPTTWVDLQSGFDAFFPVGLHLYWKSMFLDDLPDEAIQTMVEWAASRPSPMDAVTVWHLGGAVGRVAEDATAYSRRDAPYLVSGEATWTNPEDDDANIAWSRGMLKALERWSRGGLYLNFPGGGNVPEDVVNDAFGDKVERLARVKAEYDPHNLFRTNLNIAPKA